MKKFMIKATALAIGALVGSGAFAAVADITTVLGSTADAEKPKVYAQELKYNTTGLKLAPTNGNVLGQLGFKTPLGFGISGSATRYIRIDLVNGKFVTPLGATLGTDIVVGNATTVGNSSVVISAGGAEGDSYVIYQVTTGSGQAQASDAMVSVNLVDATVTSTGSALAVKYSLHETGTSAVAGFDGASKLAGKVGDIATFATGLSLVVAETGTATASVEAGFKTFVANTGVVYPDNAATPVNRVVKLGKVTYGVSAARGRDGGTVALAALVANGTKLVVKGDFTAIAGTGDDAAAITAAKLTNVFISGNDACPTTPGGTAATAFVADGASFTLNEAAVAGKAVCYFTTGTTAVPAADYGVRVDVTTDADATSSSLAEKAGSKIVRDGTELQAPFVTIHPDYLARVVLTSQHTADAAVTASTILEDGSACVGGTTSFTLKAGKQLFINAKDICPSLTVTTGGTTRAAVKLIIAAPKSKVEGVFNMMNYDAVTGKTSSLSAYPMLRPTAAN